MTTVAFDGKIIAVDSQVSVSMGPDFSHKSRDFVKGRILNTVSGKALVIVTGIVSDFLDAIPLIEQGKTPELTEDETELLMVKGGKVYALVPESSPEHGQQPKRVPSRVIPVTEVGAWGSGYAYAYTILRLKGTAPQAVVTATEIDLYSGGRVHAWDVATLSPVKVSQKLPKVIA